VIERAQDADNKERLRALTTRAAEIGLPGAPFLVAADGEVFWGNDRLEEALDWAVEANA
jgi:2-hydroxychromene-2-carboxylate isomerase